MTHVATESTSHDFKLHCIYFLSWFTFAWNPITAALVGDAKGCELEDCNLDFGKSKAPKRTSNKFGDSISLLHTNAGSCQGPAFAISESNIADL